MTMVAPALDPFQLDTLDFMDRTSGRLVLADPMGARKTGTTLAWLAQQPAGQRILVVAPSAVHKHWVREAERFHPDAAAVIGKGSKAQRTMLLESIANGDVYVGRGRCVSSVLYITTYEGMKQDQWRIEQAKFHGVVFDEGHRLKGRRTQVALSANAVTKHRLWLICITGTPVLNHAAELWQYLHMLFPKKYTAFWKWAGEHFVIEIKNFKGNRFPTRLIHDYRPGHEEIVRQQIAECFLQRDIAELFPGEAWVEEPEHVEIPVELTPAERKAYDNLVKHKWGIINGIEITTSNPLDLNTRLTQITSDWGGVEKSAENGSKVKATVELVTDLLERDEPVVVFTWFNETADRIVAGLAAKKVKVRKYAGDDDSQAFEHGKCDVIVGTLASMGEGVDGLQKASGTVVMVDRFWTPAKNDQAIGRVRRSGQERRVTVYHVFAEETIDATITSACLRKTNVVQSLKNKPLLDVIYGRA